VKTKNCLNARGTKTPPDRAIVALRASGEARVSRGILGREFSHIDGRPRFAKPSIEDGKQVKIAAIDPDF
ncbi:MAG: hypothetical protein WAL92_12845, partial [Thiogranum sp.]